MSKFDNLSTGILLSDIMNQTPLEKCSILKNSYINVSSSETTHWTERWQTGRWQTGQKLQARTCE